MAGSGLERAQLVLLLETFTRRVSLALGEEHSGSGDGGGGCNGGSAAALDSPAVRALLAGPDGAAAAAAAAAGEKGERPGDAAMAEAYYDGLRERVTAALRQAEEAAAAAATDEESAAAALLLFPVLCAGVRCLRAFAALAVTGPARAGVPSVCSDAIAATDPSAGTPSGARGLPTATATSSNTGAELGRDSATAAERWVSARLREDGEDLETRVPHLDLLLAARECLLSPWPRRAEGGGDNDVGAAAAAAADIVDSRLPTWHWWALRAAALHQQVLSGRSASLHALAARSGAAAAAWARALQQQQQQQQQQLGRGEGQGGDGSAQAGEAAAKATAAAARFLSAVPSLPPATAAILCACAHLEFAGAAHREYGYVELAQAALGVAAGALGVEVAVFGALGRRTVHQADAKAQLVARVRGAGGEPGSADGAGALSLDEDMAALGLETLIGSAREIEGVREDGAVFLAPRLEEDEGQRSDGAGTDGSGAPNTTATATAGRHHGHPAVEQALLLAWASQVERRGAEDELSRWEAAPYVEAVLREPLSQPALQVAARLLKARHEAGRGRTRERALITLEALADYAVGAPPGATVSALTADTDAAVAAAAAAAAATAATTSAPATAPASAPSSASAAAVAARLPYSFTARQPLLPSLQKELAAAYVALGLPGPALELYARLEAWDALIICYRLLGKAAAVRELISARLEATPEDPSLWCALGDLAEEGGGPGGDRHYEEAWRRSRGRSARAKRSLARSALRRRDYAGAAAHYEDALALSPMHAQAWFSLGYCRLREAGDVGAATSAPCEPADAADAAAAAADDVARLAPALRAFSRVTLLDPQHGEAWANLSALWLRAGRPREALSAAQQAVKLKRESWQAWENYAAAALQAREPLKAARALREVLSLTRGERLSGQLAEGLVAAVEEAEAEVAAAGAAALAAEYGGGTGRAAAAAAAAAAPAAAEGAAAAEEEEDEDAEAARDPVQATEALFAMLDLTRAGGGAVYGEEGGSGGSTDQAEAPPPSSSAGRYDGTEASAAVRRRQHAQLLDATSAFLREAALAPACAAATWALVARTKALRGEHGAAREAWVKACRGLAGDGAYRADPGAFAALAEASARYGRSCARAYREARAAVMQRAEEEGEGRGGGGSATAAAAAAPAAAAAALGAAGRDLAACRMHLRSVIKECEERFGGEEGHRSMAAALEEVMELEEDAKARRQAQQQQQQV